MRRGLEDPAFNPQLLLRATFKPKRDRAGSDLSLSGSDGRSDDKGLVGPEEVKVEMDAVGQDIGEPCAELEVAVTSAHADHGTAALAALREDEEAKRAAALAEAAARHDAAIANLRADLEAKRGKELDALRSTLEAEANKEAAKNADEFKRLTEFQQATKEQRREMEEVNRDALAAMKAQMLEELDKEKAELRDQLRQQAAADEEKRAVVAAEAAAKDKQRAVDEIKQQMAEASKLEREAHRKELDALRSTLEACNAKELEALRVSLQDKVAADMSAARASMAEDHRCALEVAVQAAETERQSAIKLARAEAEAEATTAATRVQEDHAAELAALKEEVANQRQAGENKVKEVEEASAAALAAAASAAAEEQVRALKAQRVEVEAALAAAMATAQADQETAERGRAAAEAAREEAFARCAAEEGKVALLSAQCAEEASKRGDMEERFYAEQRARREVHNKLLELQGNIRVFCRVRPVLEAEKKRVGRGTGSGGGSAAEGVLSANVAEFPDQGRGDQHILLRKDEDTLHKFEFDHVFPPEAPQDKVFAEVRPIVTSVLDGYRACIFAYGQTGSGKTYTMTGPPGDLGVNGLSLKALFALCEERAAAPKGWSFAVTVSMLEVYNEMLRDLLAGCTALVRKGADEESKGGTGDFFSAAGSGAGAAKKEAGPPSAPPSLEVKHGKGGSCYVDGLVAIPVSTPAEVLSVMEHGNRTRSVGRTNMNEHSSRSHLVVSVTVRGTRVETGERTTGKLHLVDLAGSERLSKSHATGARLKEAQAINKSLSALGDVIHALGRREKHVPYRNSKLTYLLSDSLGGGSKVLMFVNCSPIRDSVGETICSLNFAQRCRRVVLGAAKRHTESAEVARCRQRIAELEALVVTPTRAASAGSEAPLPVTVRGAVGVGARSRSSRPGGPISQRRVSSKSPARS